MESKWETSDPERPWYSSLSTCFNTCAKGGEKKAPQHNFSVVVRQQPGSESQPACQYGQGLNHSSTWARESLSQRPHSFELQQRSRSFDEEKRRRERIRRSEIGLPTYLRHIAHKSFDFPGDVPAPAEDETSSIERPRRTSYRPLELSVYVPDHGLSTILHHSSVPQSPASPPSLRPSSMQSLAMPSSSMPVPLFEEPFVLLPPSEENPVIATPAPARLADSRDDAYVLGHQRSHSSMPFHLHRRQNPDASTTSESAKSSESSTAFGKGSRVRSTTTHMPEVTSLVQRIAGAMIDLEKLQERIDCVVKRQSVYLGTHRISNVYPLFAQSLDRLPSMPPVPPPNGPSFAERIKGRRQTLSSSQSRRQSVLLESRRPRTVLVSPTHFTPTPQTPVKMSVEADSKELAPQSVLSAGSRLSAQDSHHSHLRTQSFVSVDSHTSFLRSHRTSVTDSIYSAAETHPESSVRGSSWAAFEGASAEPPVSPTSIHERAYSVFSMASDVHYCPISILLEATFEAPGRPASVCSVPDDRPDSAIVSMDDMADHDRDAILLSPCERTAMIAVSQKPRTVITSGRSLSVVPKERPRTLIMSKYTLDLISPIRTALKTEENSETLTPSSPVIPAEDAKTVKEEEEEEEPVETITPALESPVIHNPRTSLRRKRSLSQLNWHVFPTTRFNSHRMTIGQNIPRNANGREGFYSCIALRKESLRSSIDSISTASTAATPTETNMSHCNSSAVETMPVVTVEAVEDIKMTDADCVNPEEFIMDPLSSKHISFDFGLLGQDIITMSFEPIDSSAYVDDYQVSDEDDFDEEASDIEYDQEDLAENDDSEHIDTSGIQEEHDVSNVEPDSDKDNKSDGGHDGHLDNQGSVAVLKGIAFRTEDIKRSVGVAY